MIGIPFIMRPEKETIYSPPCKKPTKARRDGFSDMLAALLAMVLKDGFADRVPISLLKDVYPFAEPCDKRQIEALLSADIKSKRICTERAPLCSELVKRPPLSRTERLLGLMNALKKYSRKDTEDMFCMLERMINLSRLMGGGGDPMRLVMEMLPKGSMGDMEGMFNMLRASMSYRQ